MPVARLREIADDESGQKKPPGLDVLGVDSVVADFCCREGDELPGVGGVGKYLLVARHPRVEHDLAESVLPRAERDAVKDGSVVQRKERRALPLSFPFLIVVHGLGSILAAKDAKFAKATSSLRSMRSLRLT